MNTGSINFDGQYKLKSCLTNVSMSIIGILLFSYGILLAFIVLTITVILAPFVALRLRYMHRRFRHARQSSGFAEESNEGASVIDGKYKVLDR
jgi:membrane protein implicated in regulation of membrane protease activity